MKFVVGSLQFKPGTRDTVLAEIQPLVAEIRREPGNILFEFNPKFDNPDVAFLTECFVDDAAHRAHKTLPHMVELFARLGEVVVGSDIKVHFADELFPDD